MVEIKYLFVRLVLKCYLKENIWSTLILSITKVRSGICLEEDGRNKVFVCKAGIKMLFEGKYLVDFNSEYY